VRGEDTASDGPNPSTAATEKPSEPDAPGLEEPERRSWPDGLDEPWSTPADPPPRGWPEVLVHEEAAVFLRIKPRTLSTYVSRGEIPAMRAGDQLRYWREALIEAMSRRARSKPTARPSDQQILDV